MAEQLELFPNDNDLREQFPANVEGSAEFNKAISEPKYINRAEWCFQFFDGDVVPFAYSKEDGTNTPLTLEVYPIESDGLQFSYKGMVFRIFAREMSEETKELVKNESQD